MSKSYTIKVVDACSLDEEEPHEIKCRSAITRERFATWAREVLGADEVLAWAPDEASGVIGFVAISRHPLQPHLNVVQAGVIADDDFC